MYPVLLKLGKISLYTYGLMLALGFLAGIWAAKKEARRLGESPDRITDLCFYLLISAIIGSRLFYVIVEPQSFIDAPLEIFKIWNGGLVFYGGFLAAFATAAFFIRRHAMPLWRTLDILVPGLALGHAIGRLGCFFAGCCYGEIAHLPWAITFYHPESLAPTGIPLHPTQLYSAANNFAIFAFLWFYRTRKRFDGQIFWLYVLIYGVTRTIIEIFRGDFRGQYILGFLSTSQVIGILAALVAFSSLIYLLLKDRKREDPQRT